VTRLFAGLKRAGRVTDVIWFQQNPDYAREVLRLAAEDDDETVRKLGADLQVHLREFLALPPPKLVTAKVPAVSLPAAAPVATPAAAVEPPLLVEPEPAAKEEFVNQYIGRLR